MNRETKGRIAWQEWMNRNSMHFLSHLLPFFLDGEKKREREGKMHRVRFHRENKLIQILISYLFSYFF